MSTHCSTHWDGTAATSTARVWTRSCGRTTSKRFAFDTDARRICASQGHSLPVDLGLAPREPPERLLHGTATRFLHAIRRSGLQPRSRRHVRLSEDAESARRVGLRHGLPAILGVRAAAMHADGHVFHRADNGVWLTAHVPVRYIDFPACALA